MEQLIDTALNWASQPGPPNWVFVIALLTAPWTWNRYVKKGMKVLQEKYIA